MASVGVSVLHEDASVLDDVAYAIERCDGIHLAALSAVRGEGVILASPLSFPRAPGSSSLVVLSTGDPLADARAGFAANARGFVRWPDDAGNLGAIVASAAVGHASSPSLGRAIAFVGARGGAGTSTIACLLAAHVEGSLLIDLSGGGQLAFADDDAGGSLERAAAAPLPDVVASACESHAAGRALLPAEVDRPVPVATFVRTLVRSAQRVASVVVIDCGRDAPAFEPDVTFLVCAADVASVRAARSCPEERALVVTRMRRSALRAAHVEKALGRAPVAVMPMDRSLARAADVGLLPRRPSRPVKRFVAALREGAGL